MEKALPPSKRKIEKAKKEGNVAKSPILTSSCILLWCFLVLCVLTRISWLRLQFLLPLGGNDLHVANKLFLLLVVGIVTVVLGGAAVVGCCSELLQSGGAWRKLVNFSRIAAFSPVTYLKQAKLKFFTSLIYTIIFIPCAITIILFCLPQVIFNASSTDVLQIILNKVLIITLIFGFIAVADWLIQRHNYLTKLRMSFDEMKREIREDEGDFYIRAQRKALHEQMIYEEIVKRVRQCRFIVVEKR